MGASLAIDIRWLAPQEGKPWVSPLGARPGLAILPFRSGMSNYHGFTCPIGRGKRGFPLPAPTLFLEGEGKRVSPPLGCLIAAPEAAAIRAAAECRTRRCPAEAATIEVAEEYRALRGARPLNPSGARAKTEREGFEPSSHLVGGYTPSKRALSTAQTPLHCNRTGNGW